MDQEQHNYVLYWKDGTTEVVTGPTLYFAFKNAGYTPLDLARVDFYTTGIVALYEWTGKTWKKI